VARAVAPRVGALVAWPDCSISSAKITSTRINRRDPFLSAQAWPQRHALARSAGYSRLAAFESVPRWARPPAAPEDPSCRISKAAADIPAADPRRAVFRAAIGKQGVAQVLWRTIPNPLSAAAVWIKARRAQCPSATTVNLAQGRSTWAGASALTARTTGPSCHRQNAAARGAEAKLIARAELGARAWLDDPRRPRS